MIKIKTQIIKINPELVELDKIAIIAQTLGKEGVIAYPTDTFYGLGANCFSRKAIQRIYQIKKRKQEKPLSVVISDMDMVEEIVASIPPSFFALATEFWPGPLTLILKAAPQFPEELLGTGRTLGIRLPAVSWLRELVRQVGFPVTATSANISGQKEIALPEEIIKIFSEKVELIVDGGKAQGILPSTIVDLASGKPKILREGAVSHSMLTRYLGTQNLIT
jgi:L-threonylcarbamoyladenylate synthase